MAPQPPAISARHLEAAALVFEGHSMREVARRLAVDESTVREWSKRPEWKAHVADLERAAKSTAMDRAVKTLRAAVEPAAATLSEIVLDTKAKKADRIRASVAVLDRTGVGPHSFQHTEENELEGMSVLDIERMILDSAVEIVTRHTQSVGWTNEAGDVLGEDAVEFIARCARGSSRFCEAFSGCWVPK